MMKQAWRIVKANYAATAFTGEDAPRTGGRWNSRGTWLVYSSGSQSLAALATLVHLNPPVIFKCAVMGVTFDEGLIEKIDLPDLPSDWRQEPPPPSTKEIGDLRVRQHRSAVLEIPARLFRGSRTIC